MLLVDSPESAQTYFWLANIGVNKRYTYHAALDLVNTLYGGRFTSILNTELRIKTRFEGCYTVKQCLEAVSKLLEVSGGGALAKDKVVQLHWRSLIAMKLHPFSIWENLAAPYSLVLFGLPCEAPFTKAHLGCVI